MRVMIGRLCVSDTTGVGIEERLSALKRRDASGSFREVLLLVGRRQACCSLTLVVFRTRDALFAIKRIKVPNFSLLTVFSALGFVDTWPLGIMITSEGYIDVIEESIHTVAQ